MAKYSRIESTFWKDPDIRPLRPFSKLLYLWAFSNEGCGIAGAYVVDPSTALHETDLRKAEFSHGWQQLLEYRKPDGYPLIEYDPTAHLIWVCGKLRREILHNPSPLLLKGAAKEIRRLPRSAIWAAFVARYGLHFDGLIDFSSLTVGEKVETVRVYGDAHRVSLPIPSQSQSQPNPNKSPVAPSALFSRWWDQYPRRGDTPKRGKAECWEFWRRGRLEDIGDRLIAGVGAELVARKRAAASGEFMAAPCDPIRWLRGRVWEDYEGVPAAKPVDVPRNEFGQEINRLLTPEERAEREARRAKA